MDGPPGDADSTFCACGSPIPPGARFCPSCGAALDEPAAIPEERKVVSVLFADLVGFTRRAEQLDPEEVGSLLDPYWQHLREELERHSGTVEKFVGDAVVALFGAPVAHEDDPERAVRAALAIRDWARRRTGSDVRIGVTTGEALVRLRARPEAGDVLAVGDVVNTCRRLQEAAPVNGILVDAATREATRDAIEYDDAGTVAAKGKAKPVRAWEAARARAHATPHPRPTRFVGRATELALLRGLFDRVVEERMPQLVTVVGPPGIGKTRLVSELRRSPAVEPEAEWLRGRVPSYGDGTALGALAQVVKRFAGILETDGAAQTAEKLAAAVRRLRAPEVEAASSHLRALVGLPGAAVITPDRNVESFAAWRALFEAIAATRPLVLVFEDLQWADDALLEFVDYLVDWSSGHPILVVCTARPELLRQRPDWGGGSPNAVTLTLPPLGDAETAELLAALLDEDVARIGVELRDQAAGNPLYAEQFARMMRERDAGEPAPPRTVQAVIGARIDILPPAEKRLLEDASVVGATFWPGALAAVGGVTREDAELVLHRLERNDLVLRRGSSLAGEREYAFRHALVREVAYARVPRAYRVDKHRRAAEWLAGVAYGCDQAETLAHHYVCALEAARAAGSPTTDLERGARSALRAAGEHALGLGAFAAGERRLASALELWPPDDPERSRLLLRLGCARLVTSTEGEAELLEARDGLDAAGDGEGAAEAATVLSELRWRRGDRAEAWRQLEYALTRVRDAPDSPAKAFVLGRLSRQLMLAAAYEESISTGRQALALAERLGLDELRANALNSIGSSRARSGDPGGMRDVERAIAIGVEANSPAAEVAYNNLASLFDEAGDLRRASELLREARALAERLGDRGHLEWSDRELATRCYASGDWDRLVDFAERGPAEKDGAPHYLDALVRCSHALVLQSRGETAAALRQASRGEQEARRIAEPQLLLACLADRAFVDLLAGRREAASGHADEVLETAGRTGYLPSAASFELAAVLVELGRKDELAALLDALRHDSRWFEAARAYAGGDSVRAADLYVEIGSAPAEAWARQRAAETLEDRDEAEEQRRRALAFYRSVGATIGAERGADRSAPLSVRS